MAESESEKLDRELMELLQELRVVLPGVQVLFAFLLGVPFTQRFAVLTGMQDIVYFSAFLATAVSTLCLITPTAYHRLRFRKYDKERLLKIANRMTLAGLVLLGFAICLVMFLIADVVFSRSFAVAIGGVVAALVAMLWFALPLSRQIADDE